ncbi:S-layer protein [Selenomonas sp. WCA-380-WT-3B 3/]|uniref:S-layer protein n=1 Tax=Selenomonas montiformis TaxID=2652285 RepID=A0A6I2UZZ8_9FIRM|nr:S-layer homology domain-containing protein [Selenomonas montiformis]MSV25674.1 S-layer protein [Selenomonas montiformis]
MKKTLVSALTTALVVGAASTTFAAANPFSDVPADHWAYDAVSQLAADGVIEGYGDTTFKGDRNITRYEMAQMIAKAMAKTNVGSNDKALIDKLAAEFSDELNNLGVRVANLEKNADKVKWNGEARYTYTSERHDVNMLQGNKKNTKKNKDELLLRLEPTAEVNANWQVKARLDASTNMESDSAFSGDSDKVKLQRIWAQGNYKNFQTKLGKFPDGTAYDNSMMLNNQMSGAEVTVGNQLKATLRAGRIDLNSDSQYKNLHAFGVDDDAANLQSIALTYQLGKAVGTAAYYHADSDVFKNANHQYLKFNNNADEDEMSTWEVAGKYRFDKNVALGGAYAENTKADSYEKAGFVQLDYKGAQKANKGTWGAYVAYRHQGAGVVIDPNVDGVGYNQKGWEVGTSYTLFKNTVASAKYFNGKDLHNDKDASKLFGRVEFFF